jgi:hypothetical protein
MKRLRVLLLVTVGILAPILVLVAAFTVGDSLAARSGVASIRIISPAENALVQADEEYALSNEVAGERKEFTSICGWMAQEPGVYSSKGSYVLPRLNPGEYVIALKLVDTDIGRLEWRR